MDANDLRRAFTAFFVERGHTEVASASLIPHDPTLLFTVAGMVPFKPYFLGDAVPPFPRATSVQKCFRTADIDIIGTTSRHLTFFEMLGNFSFGDYFKESAIPWAWELVTTALGLDPDRLWVTVHTSDDEAEAIWRELVGVPSTRIQRLGDEDNWWGPPGGVAGPCGPCSEIYYDRGPERGDAGGPAQGGAERYVEIWNLVFMQFNRQPDGADPSSPGGFTDVDLPKKNIDTGAGLERILPILQGTDSVYDTDVLRPIVAAAEAATGRRYGDDQPTDVALRILADHARAMTFLVSDGVVPSNEDRGYVLRRIIRRAVRRAFQLGVDTIVTPGLVDATVAVMGEAYPDLVRNHDMVLDVTSREEARFRQTLRSGLAILETELEHGDTVSGAKAFQLHDTFGFPIDLTREIAAERGVEIDLAGFEEEMARQRRRSRADRRTAASAEPVEVYRGLLEEFGNTEFTGYREYESDGRVLAVVTTPGDGEAATSEVFLDRTPFYAESGGQIGDIGTITTSTGVARVLDTTYALPGLHRHVVEVLEGELVPDQDAHATIDGGRREAVRRNHTGTHLLHWALREVLGAHVKQAGSHVASERLRFDFSHYGPVDLDELAKAEALANEQVLSNDPVRAYETSMEEAQRLGALAFFGDKYGDIVRVVEAGRHSVELCGGTHVHALGMVGPLTVVAESSIGANLRRVEALTGAPSLERIRQMEALLERSALLLRVDPEELPERLERELEHRKALEQELRALRRQVAGVEAATLAAQADAGVVVARRDGTTRDELRELAVAVRDQPGVRAVVLGGAPEGGGAALVAAVVKGSGLVASDLLAEAARTVGGGVGRSPDLAVAGGRDPSRMDEALRQAQAAAHRG